MGHGWNNMAAGAKTQGSKQVGVSPPPPTFSDIRKNPKIPEARIPSRKQPRYRSLEWAVAAQAQTNPWSPRAGLASLCSVRYRAHLNSSLDSRVPSHGTVPHETSLGGLSTVDREPTYHRRRSGPQSGLATLNLSLLLETRRHDVFTLFTPSDGVMVSDGFDGGLNPTARSRRIECCAGQKFGLKYLFFLSSVDLEQPALSCTASRRSIVDLGRLVATALGAYQTLARTDSMGSFHHGMN
ncbi:hypothetical protein CTAM01_09967 [Colletotrichum tamarilloi]|uniref:Uncharacterized protein n=1 Tax=Colletotrichum tamarilloi TaxID=1209934 RepID=A0ABQ9R1I4_9PEZI|nr:uncharacterized protein CTAM01_09967 [Colletotrichum tamarilloi]KAK1492173.1 hypothetical protein CTAM01_09967 [Colletotrichum tamarilloi]